MCRFRYTRKGTRRKFQLPELGLSVLSLCGITSVARKQEETDPAKWETVFSNKQKIFFLCVSQFLPNTERDPDDKQEMTMIMISLKGNLGSNKHKTHST